MQNRQHFEVAKRVCEVRLDLYGQCGAPLLAEALGLPTASWLNFERGVNMPAHVLLAFLDLTGANPTWLLSGAGSRYAVRESALASRMSDLPTCEA
jgi:hypothetical protein